MITDLADIFWHQQALPMHGNARTDTFADDDVLTMVDLPLKVMLFNDNYHTFDEVIGQICKATACSQEHAESCAWEVHTAGKSVVYDGEMGECLRVSSVLEEIALHTQILS